MTLLQLVHGFVTGAALLAAGVLLAFHLLAEPLYRRRWRPASGAFEPSVAVFVPCRGIEDGTRDNIRRILDLAWPSRELFFIVESEDDPAHELLSRVVAGRPDAHLVIAGRSRCCAQKAYNLAVGVEASRGRGEVLVFLDSDLEIDPGWLHRLLEPLADPRVAATSGGAWVMARAGTLGKRTHAFWFSLMHLLMSFPLFHGVAGCSTAIRRSEFESLGVAAAWHSALSDDMSLTRVLGAGGRRAVFVPGCLGLVRDGAPTIRQALAWIKRQGQMAKYGLRSMWLLAVVGFGVVYTNLLAVPVLAVVAISAPEAVPLLLQTAGASLLFCIGGALLRFAAPANERSLAEALLSPVFIVLSYTGFVASAFTRTVRWAGTEYRMAFDGRIRRIVRH